MIFKYINTHFFIIVGAYVALMFFALEVVLLSGLQFATTYFHAQLIIAISLFAMAIGGLLASLVTESCIRKWTVRALSVLFSAPLIGIVAVVISLVYPFWSVVLLAIAFLPIGFVLSLLYRTVSSWHLYAAELLGAVAGLILVVLLLPTLREENTLLLLSVFAGMAFFALAWKECKKHQLVFYGALLLFLTVLAVSNIRGNHLNFAVDVLCDPVKADDIGIKKIMCMDELGFSYTVLKSIGSIVNRIDIIHSNRDTFRIVAFSGKQNDIIQPYSADKYIHDARIPSGIIDEPKTLLIGSGAEGVAKVAKSIGATDITVVELNPAIIELWENDDELNAFSHSPFEDTTLVYGEGRSYLQKRNETFDLITLMNTHRALNLMQFGQPDFLHTKEAFIEMLTALTDRGFISLEEPSKLNVADEEIARIIKTLKAALYEQGAENPEDHLIVYQWVGVQKDELFNDKYELVYTQILIKKTPWSVDELDSFRYWAASSHNTMEYVKPSNMAFYRQIWYPDTGVNDDLRLSVIARAVTENDNTGEILTDNNPFSKIISEFDKHLLLSMFIIFGLVILVYIFWWYECMRNKKISAAWPLYFVFIGFGYMFAEIFLLQWVQYYVGSVLVSFVITIGGLFVAGALTTLLFWQNKKPTIQQLFVLLIGVGIILYYFQNMSLHDVSMTMRMLVSIVIIAIVGGLLAPFFPYGISTIKHQAGRHVPLLVGINATALAMGVPLAFLVGAYGGFHILVVVTISMYSLALIVLWRHFSS